MKVDNQRAMGRGGGGHLDINIKVIQYHYTHMHKRQWTECVSWPQEVMAGNDSWLYEPYPE